MIKDKLSYWFSILTNLGVLIGVVFLAYEIQHNNELLVQESRYSLLQNQKDWKMFLNGDPKIAKLIYSASIDELSEIDKLRRFDILSGVLLTWQWEWEQSKSGLFGDSNLPIEGFRTLWKMQNYQLHWAELKPILNPDFADFLETEIAN